MDIENNSEAANAEINNCKTGDNKLGKTETNYCIPGPSRIRHVDQTLLNTKEADSITVETCYKTGDDKVDENATDHDVPGRHGAKNTERTLSKLKYRKVNISAGTSDCETDIGDRKEVPNEQTLNHHIQ